MGAVGVKYLFNFCSGFSLYLRCAAVPLQSGSPCAINLFSTLIMEKMEMKVVSFLLLEDVRKRWSRYAMRRRLFLNQFSINLYKFDPFSPFRFIIISKIWYPVFVILI